MSTTDIMTAETLETLRSQDWPRSSRIVQPDRGRRFMRVRLERSAIRAL
ncbi:hypothetical protein V5F77_21735 [Xanthobacter sp. DSM 24535]